jgi:hypothetical protein
MALKTGTKSMQVRAVIEYEDEGARATHPTETC